MTMSEQNETVEVPNLDDHRKRTEEILSEDFVFTDQDVETLHNLDIKTEMPNFHTILEVWREVLKPAKDELTAAITPQWATRIVGAYAGITFADMVDVRESLFTKLVAFQDILLAEIASDDECLTYTTPEEDAEHNSEHYRNLLRDWQLAMVRWEMDWDCTSPAAGAEIAALSELHKMVFGPTGVTAFLDNIRFEYTEADQAELAQALEELKEGRGE